MLHSFDVGAPVNQITLNRDNNLLAATADDLKLRLFDLSSRRLVREFDGHSNRITDVCLSPDGRWVRSSCHAPNILCDRNPPPTHAHNQRLRALIEISAKWRIGRPCPRA